MTRTLQAWISGVRAIDKKGQADERANEFPRFSSGSIAVTLVPQPLDLSLDAHARSLAPLRRALTAWLADIGAGDTSDVVLAVDEAVANAIEHAGLPVDGSIAVQAHVVDTTLHIEVRDHGVWREPMPDDARGRGLLIMNTVMDGVSVEHRDGATLVVMTRGVRRGRSNALFADAQ
jgi:anti-sigma regulatory factor (Ser/Thr protein kinase)